MIEKKLHVTLYEQFQRTAKWRGRQGVFVGLRMKTQEEKIENIYYLGWEGPKLA